MLPSCSVADTADDFITLSMRGVRGDHGHVSEQQTFSAWRIDTLLGDVNLTTMYAQFRNNTQRATSYFTAGMPALKHADWRDESIRRLMRSPADPRALTAEAAPNASSARAGDGVFVGGCAGGSLQPLGIIAVDLSWVYDPAFQVAFVGEEDVLNVTTQHWASRRCRDVWIRTWEDEHGPHAVPVRVRVLAISDVVNFGCQPPVQTADFTAMTELTPEQAATTSPVFMPPPQCIPSTPASVTPVDDDAVPPWVWGIVGGLVCLLLGSIVGFLIGACRSRGSSSSDETRERFSSHLLDVI